MSAGGSQAVATVRAALRRTARERDAPDRRHLAGCRGERVVCKELSRLALDGILHLDDRRRRADPDDRANIDHLVIGPQGVFVVDAKNWAGTITVRNQHLLQDGRPVDHRLIALGHLTQRVAEVLQVAGFAVRPHAVVCFTTRRSDLAPVLGRTLLTDTSRLGDLLRQRPVVLAPEQVQRLTDLLAYAFPSYALDPRELALAEGLLFGEDETRHAGLTEALRRPVQEWVAWLHPEQATLSRRSFAGPARVRGAAGTGKTAVALHRVAWLAATRPGRLLVTSHVRTLPGTLRTAYAELSPASLDRVDFISLHAVARELTGARQSLGDTAFELAWRECHVPRLDRRYVRQEVDSVLKGRDVTSLETYLTLDRVGRRTPLRAEQREQVWTLRVAYDELLEARGELDPTDVLRLARDQVRERGSSRWTSVVVDEVQDLSLVGLQLAYELAGRDRPDGLFLVGDGQQAIYPGGFRMAEAGIALAGRGVVLRTNYRNTVEVLAAARGVLDAVDADHDEDPDSGTVEVVRHGALPVTAVYDCVSDHDAALLWDLQAHRDRGGRWSDVAVLCQGRQGCEDYARLLRKAKVPTVLLTDLTEPVDAVRVGTWARSKGLEFGHVYLPRAQVPAGDDEQATLQRRQLYVAMTRARDTLWVGRLHERTVGPA